MTFDEMQLLMQQLFVAQRELQARQESMQTREEVIQTRQDNLQSVVESNSRAIQAMLDQAAEDRLNREEERLAQEQRTREHEERMGNIEALSQRLVQVQEGMANLLISFDEDRPTVLRKLNTIDNKVDVIIDRLSPN
jgi:ATPase subunit of ABC transporter with duplicated ATPase domains